MLCLIMTRPRTCTYAHTYYPYRLEPSSVECFMSIGARLVIETILYVQTKERFAF